jgi:hypothetical protein
MHRSANGILHSPAHIVGRFRFEGPPQLLDKPLVCRNGFNAAAQFEGDAKAIEPGPEVR